MSEASKLGEQSESEETEEVSPAERIYRVIEELDDKAAMLVGGSHRIKVEDGLVTLIQDRFGEKFIQTSGEGQHWRNIQQAVASVFPDKTPEIQIEVTEYRRESSTPVDSRRVSRNLPRQVRQTVESPDPTKTFERFIVTPNTEYVYRMLTDLVAAIRTNASALATGKPISWMLPPHFIIYGRRGDGKSHLAIAVHNALRNLDIDQRNYRTGAHFANQYRTACADGKQSEFIRALENKPLLILDGIEDIPISFIKTLELLDQQLGDRQQRVLPTVVVTTAEYFLEDRHRGKKTGFHKTGVYQRLKGFSQLPIRPPNDGDAMKVIETTLGNYSFNLDPKIREQVLVYITDLAKCDGRGQLSVRSIQARALDIIRYGSNGHPITLEGLAAAFPLRAFTSDRLPVTEIASLVLQNYPGISLDQVRSGDKTAIEPREIAVYAASEAGYSPAEIVTIFGGNERAVSPVKKRVAERMPLDRQFGNLVKAVLYDISK